MSDADLTPGLEGVPVAETRLSDIDGERGELVVGGYPVDELAGNASYEEVLFLLLRDRLPTADELAAFRADLAARRGIGDEVRAVLRRAAAAERPAMDALRMGVAAADLDAGGDASPGSGESPDPEAVARRLVAVVPTVVATYWRYRQGAEPVAPREDLGHAANYLHMLHGEEPTEAAVRGLETYLATVVDHGLNASTFAARVVVSTESDLVSAATAAVGALKGPLHGGAPGPVLDMLREVQESGDPARYVRETLAAGDRLMGFGHRVYRVRDPRAAVLSAAAERFYADDGDGDAADGPTDASGDDASGDANAGDDLFATAAELESVAVDALAERHPDRRLDTNVEYYTAVLLDGVGVPQPLFTPTFAVARMGGWMAHALEQRAGNRLVRPSSRYVGATGRTWTPVEER